MKHQKMKAWLLMAVFACSSVATRAQQKESSLQSLVEDSAQRLAIAHQVALAKWDSGSPVEDLARELQVIQKATAEAQSKGLDESFLTAFFRSQIEANKMVQYSLLADWRRVGRAPAHQPVNLQSTIRPELDRIQSNLIMDLVHTSALRSQPDCPVVAAKAVGQYRTAQHQRQTNLDAIALNRALATICTH
jgi:chorismate mutase